MTLRTISLAALLSLLPAGQTAAASATRGEGVDWVPGEVLLRFHAGVATRAIQASLATQGHDLAEAVDGIGLYRARTAPGQTVLEAVAAYANDPLVIVAQPNFIYRASAVPNDPYYGQVWGLKNTGQTITNGLTQPPGTPLSRNGTNNPGTPGDDMNLEAAWNLLTDCSSNIVAVVDTGVNYNHEDLAGNMWTSASYPKHGTNTVDGNDDPMDTNGHGTHVAGTIGAVGNNLKGMAGVCWTARIMAVRVLDTTGSGTTLTVTRGIDFAVANGAKVINMSLGSPTDGQGDPAFSQAIARALAADVAVVVAAGNEASNDDQVPVVPCTIAQPNVLCVAALDQKYQLATFSNWGATTVGVGAPGTNVVSTWPGTASTVPAPMTAAASAWAFPDLGWGYYAGNNNWIVNPPNFLPSPGGSYSAGISQRAYLDLPAGAVDVVVLEYFAEIRVPALDHFVTAYRAGAPGSDPFAPGGTVLDDVTNRNTLPGATAASYDVTPCKNTTCTVGFRLQASSTSTGGGVGVALVQLAQLKYDATSYNTINGTSMATPMAAGVVALVRSFNPQYRAADAVNAVTYGGRPTPSLTGLTKSGNAVDAMRALAYIAAPTGLAATVQ